MWTLIVVVLFFGAFLWGRAAGRDAGYKAGVEEGRRQMRLKQRSDALRASGMV